jgi:hypothetical protein
LHKLYTLLICFLLISFLFGCVTTTNLSTETPPQSITEEKSGILFSSKSLGNGPLLLGSIEHLSGSIMEFTILYGLYFPLSGILVPDHEYRIGESTRWQIISEKFKESVFFERALLNEDDEGRNWWYFMVEGDGYKREYEFLIDETWSLLELRYYDNGSVQTYIPSVDEINNLSNGPVLYENFIKNRENITVEAGTFFADHIVIDGGEYWTSRSVPGTFVKSIMKDVNSVTLSASLVEIKKDYKTKMNSY